MKIKYEFSSSVLSHKSKLTREKFSNDYKFDFIVCFCGCFMNKDAIHKINQKGSHLIFMGRYQMIFIEYHKDYSRFFEIPKSA